MDGSELVCPDGWVVGVPADFRAPGHFSQSLSNIRHTTGHIHIARGHAFSNWSSYQLLFKMQLSGLRPRPPE